MQSLFRRFVYGMYFNKIIEVVVVNIQDAGLRFFGKLLQHGFHFLVTLLSIANHRVQPIGKPTELIEFFLLFPGISGDQVLKRLTGTGLNSFQLHQNVRVLCHVQYRRSQIRRVRCNRRNNIPIPVRRGSTVQLAESRLNKPNEAYHPCKPQIHHRFHSILLICLMGIPYIIVPKCVECPKDGHWTTKNSMLSQLPE